MEFIGLQYPPTRLPNVKNYLRKNVCTVLYYCISEAEMDSSKLCVYFCWTWLLGKMQWYLWYILIRLVIILLIISFVIQESLTIQSSQVLPDQVFFPFCTTIFPLYFLSISILCLVLNLSSISSLQHTVFPPLVPSTQLYRGGNLYYTWSHLLITFFLAYNCEKCQQPKYWPYNSSQFQCLTSGLISGVSISCVCSCTLSLIGCSLRCHSGKL